MAAIAPVPSERVFTLKAILGKSFAKWFWMPRKDIFTILPLQTKFAFTV